MVRSRLLIIVTLTLGMATVQALPATSGAAHGPILVISAHGANVAHLGEGELVAVKVLQDFLGPPTAALVSTPGIRNCGVDAMASWHSLIAYFDHDRLVGLSLGPGTIPVGRTSAGLQLGNTLARARSLYGTALRTSNVQGGAWFVRTSDGRIDGFVEPSDARSPGSTSRILTIDVGDVGCPAMSP